MIFYAGWFVLRKRLGTIRLAALTGMFRYCIDRVLFTGGVFLPNFLFKPEGLGRAAFSGVIVSFIMFIPLAMSIGAMEGFFARPREEGTTIDSPRSNYSHGISKRSVACASLRSLQGKGYHKS